MRAGVARNVLELKVNGAAQHAFLRQFTLAQPALRRYVLAHIPDFHEAEDVLQEIAVVLWDRAGEFEEGRNFQAWAFGIARYKMLHARRSAGRRRTLLSGDLSDRFAAKLQEMGPRYGQNRNRLRDCVKKLADRARTLVELRYDKGRSTQEIAEETGTSVNAVRVLLCRVRRSLARCITGAHG